MSGNIDADFLHPLDGQGMNVSGRLGSGTLHIKYIAGNRSEDAFGQMAAAGITGAQNQDGRLRFLIGHLHWMNLKEEARPDGRPEDWLVDLLPSPRESSQLAAWTFSENDRVRAMARILFTT